MTTSVVTTQATPEQVEALAGRIFMAGLGAVELYTVHLGIELGLYEALDAAGSATAAELAQRTGLDGRYVREWLQSQAISGVALVDGDHVDSGRFALAPGVRETLIDPVSPAYVGAIPAILPTVGAVTPALIAAFRTGEPVAFTRYGPDAVAIQEAMNRPAFEHALVGEWLPQLPDVAARLADTTRPARVADICCGSGWAAIALAEAYPHISVDGYDNDEASIARARRNATARGVSGRVTFNLRDVTSDAFHAPVRYDAAFVFEAVHDLPRPVEALANCRQLLAPGAPLIVMDERVGEQLAAPGDEVERFMAAVTVVWCTPQGRGPDSEVVGAVIRPGVMLSLAQRAGFASTEILPIEHPFWRFYRLEP